MVEAVRVGAAVCSVFVAGSVVEVEAQESQGDAERLDRGGGAAEPDDGDDDDEDALDEGGDGVGDGGDHGEDDEGEDVLGEVGDAVEDEFEREGSVVKRAGFVREVYGAVV